MYISKEQYNKRERFETHFDCDFETFVNKINFSVGTIFVAKTMQGKEKLIKITCEFAEIVFDIRECDENGQYVRLGYRRGSISKKEIAERLYEGDWKTINCLFV